MAQDKSCKKIALLDAALSSQLLSLEFWCSEETFEKLLQKCIKDIDMDYVIPSEGNTLLHLANSLGETGMCEALIRFRADFTSKSKDGLPLLHLKSDEEYRSHFFFKKDSFCGFEDVVFNAHIQFNNTTNPSDNNGISHFHMSCMYNKVELAELFLASGVSVNGAVNKNSPIYSGYTPLHFAAKYCAIETVELLLKRGADAFIKSSKALNPLHVLIDEKLNTWIQMVRRVVSKADLEQSGYYKLALFHAKIERIITLLLEKDDKCGFGLYDDTGLSHFHVLCTMQDNSIVEQFLDRHKVNLEQAVCQSSALWPGYTALHFAAHFSIDTVELLVERGANLATKDAKGQTPFDICLSWMKVEDIHSIYCLQRAWANICFSDGKTKLSDFIYAMRDSSILTDFMKNCVDDANIFIPFDSPICAGYTPLHLNVICKEMPRNWNPKCVDLHFPSNETLMRSSRISECTIHESNIYATDARGSTPIHLAFNLQESFVAFDLLQFHQTITNIVDERGFSLLHIACAAERSEAVAKLLADGADVNESTKSSYTWYELKPRPEAMSIDGHLSIAKGSTPLHIAAILQNSKIVELLLDHGADVLAKDADNLIPLERSLEMPIFESDRKLESNYTHVLGDQVQVLELLVLRVSELIGDSRPDEMLYCYSLLKDKVLNRLLTKDHEPTRRILAGTGITKLHVACYTKILHLVESELENATDVNVRVASTSPLWPGSTPLHILMKNHEYNSINDSEEHVAIANLLLKRGADVTAKNALDYTPLHQILRPYLMSGSNAGYVDMLLGHVKDFNVNHANTGGLTFLHAACARNNVPVIEKLLEHGAEVHQEVDYFDPRLGGWTALHFAAARRSKEAVDVLLRYGADVHWKNVFEETPLHAAAPEERRLCVNVVQSLISAGADINARNVFGERPLEKLLKSYYVERKAVKLFVNEGCPVNCWNPMTEAGCLAVALTKSETSPIFKTMLKAADVANIGEKGRNAIHNVVSFVRLDWLDIDDTPIEEMFISAKKYTKEIERLIKFDLNMDHQDREGKTPLHIAAEMGNVTGIDGLLNNGANVNIVDDKGKPPFAYSLEHAKRQDCINQVDREILTIIGAHLCKLTLISDELSTSNIEIMHNVLNIVPLNDTWCQECSEEFRKMMSRHIDLCSITLHDLMSNTGAVSFYPSMFLDEKNALDNFFNKNSAQQKRIPQIRWYIVHAAQKGGSAN